MTRSLWTVSFVLILACFQFASASLSAPARAAASAATGPSQGMDEVPAANQPARSIAYQSPVIQLVVGLVTTLFGVLTLVPFLGNPNSARRNDHAGVWNGRE